MGGLCSKAQGDDRGPLPIEEAALIEQKYEKNQAVEQHEDAAENERARLNSDKEPFGSSSVMSSMMMMMNAVTGGDQNQLEKDPMEVDYHAWIPTDDESIEDSFLGEVYLTVQHIALSEELVVRIKRAKNLLRRGPTANPYFKLSLVPDPAKKYSFKTEVKESTFDPIIDESFTFPKVSDRDTEKKVLKIAAFDDTQPKRPYIGELNIKLSKIGLDLAIPRWIPLRKDPAMDVPPAILDEVPTIIEPVSPVTIPQKTRDTDAYSVAPSMISAMSAASMAGIVKKHDYGKIHLSLHYKLAKQTLQVVVIAARLNKTPGSPGIPNPYTKLYMIPDPSKKSKQKTKPQRNTLDPVFNESFEFKVENKDISEKKLQLTIWDHETLGRSTFYGEALVRLATLPPNETVNKWFPLDSLSYGEVLCQLSYDATTDYLSVTIIRGRDFTPTRAGASADPYVKLYLLPDRKKQTKRKTHYRKQTLDPEYNETFQYFLTEVEGSRSKVLHVSVVDHSSIGNNEVMGAFSVPVIEIIEAGKMEQWFSLIRDKASMDSQ